MQTLGELRQLIAGEGFGVRAAWSTAPAGDKNPTNAVPAGSSRKDATSSRQAGIQPTPLTEPAQPSYIYPRWPWLLPFRWLRNAFIEVVMRPLVWLLAHPAVVAPHEPASGAPLLIVANHVTTYDAPFIQYALPGSIRRRIAVAMSGEMLEDFRHFRNPDNGHFSPFGHLAYLLITALFNVFPLARQRNFQSSFAHVGNAMDRGFNVLVFPEGTRSTEGLLARFRPGIGMLVKQSGAAVLPIAIRGLGELKTGRRRWFRSGAIEVRVGQTIRFSPAETESAITARLHDEVDELLNG
jgi:long-chain acyl-CoA synthetase